MNSPSSAVPPTPTRADDLALARELARRADEITMSRFKAKNLRVHSKPDLSPVSDADLAVEEMVRAELGRARPGDAVLGEEFGGDAVFAGRQWVIDPIDGTKNYVRGVPVWASLIALLEDGIPTVGVVSAPALGRNWWAATDLGAWATSAAHPAPQRLHVSAVAELSDASLSFSSISGWPERDRFLALTDAVWRVRGYGDFLSYCLLAEGAVDLAAEPEVSLWDLAPLDVLVREAGGLFTGLDGSPGPHGGTAAASNGILHADLLSHIGS